MQSLRHSGEQNILTNACNIKLKCPENLGLNSFDCVKKSNLKCFLELWCSRFKGSESTENNQSIITLIVGTTFSENAGTAYVLQSGFILFCYGQFIIWSIFLGTKTTKIRNFSQNNTLENALIQHPPSHTHMFLIFLKKKKKNKKKKIKKNILVVISCYFVIFWICPSWK